MVCVSCLLSVLLISRVVARGYLRRPEDLHDEIEDCFNSDGNAAYGEATSYELATSSTATGRSSITARSGPVSTIIAEASSLGSLSSISVQPIPSYTPSVSMTMERDTGSIHSASSGVLSRTISRPYSIGLVTGSAKSIPLSCPSLSTSTLTTTKTLAELVYISVITVNSFTVPIFTVSGSGTYTVTLITYASTFTSYYNVTSMPTSTTIIVIPATSTTTIPTSAGFTPISCLAIYLNPTATTYVTTTRSTFAYFTSVSTAATYTSTMTPYTTEYITSPVFTELRVPTYTVTETRTAGRVYAACATNNMSLPRAQHSTE
ncbi:hypothetical protein AMS68_007439 [Peltaster fructicola]|uniref:Uncharacterized protein n=1 Tax=Peltaster fructicola TaxID=286661 RepID=A0A6H0Y4G9_9PEZI|nr:hypothetical protein AMS68_007439 [Peltaster fructicola]